MDLWEKFVKKIFMFVKVIFVKMKDNVQIQNQHHIIIYSKTPHSRHLSIVDTSRSGGAIFAGIEPLDSAHLYITDGPKEVRKK
jgi:hypothetical protein